MEAPAEVRYANRRNKPVSYTLQANQRQAVPSQNVGAEHMKRA